MFAATLNLTVQDRVRLYLNNAGVQTISATIKSIAEDMDQPIPSVYQAIHRLEANNEIELEKITLENGREKIVGIKLIKLEPSGRTYQRAADRSGKITRIKPVNLNSITVDESPSFPNLLDYMNKRLAVENMREQALNAGLDDSVIQFIQEPIYEEALVLFKLWTELKAECSELRQQYEMRGFDLEAEKRNNLYLQGRLREETTEDLIAMGSKD